MRHGLSSKELNQAENAEKLRELLEERLKEFPKGALSFDLAAIVGVSA